MNTFIRQTRQ